MKTKTKVSVIMAEYNTDTDYLKDAIESVLGQSFKDFELIIIDDCGSNNVISIVEKYKDRRIRVIKNKKNKGLVYSLNRAVEEAKTDYLVRMDTDDIASPDRIKRIYEFITSHPEYTVVGSRVMEFSESGDMGILCKSGEKTKETLIRGDGLIHPSVIMRKDAVLAVGGYPDYKRAEDLALWSELLLKGNRLYVMKDVLLKYRVNTQDYSKRKLKYRGGEIKARLHYYPLLGASMVGYLRIVKSIAAGILPTTFVRKYRSSLVLASTRMRVEASENQEQPLVSIIVPAFNAEKYIKRLLDSLESQTYKNLEVIIIDDGSTDQTLFIANEYAEKDSRIRVVSQSNSGVSSARNFGKSLSTGDFISFIDADDKLALDMYERMVSVAVQYNLDIVACHAYRVARDGTTFLQYKDAATDGGVEVYRREEALRAFLREELAGTGVWNKIFKSNLLEGIEFDEKLKINEDKLVLFRAVKKSQRVGLLNKALYYYIDQNNSATNSQFSDKFFDVEKVLDIIKEETMNMGGFRREVRGAELIEILRLYRILVARGVSGDYLSNQKRLRKKILYDWRYASSIRCLFEASTVILLPAIYNRIVKRYVR